MKNLETICNFKRSIIIVFNRKNIESSKARGFFVPVQVKKENYWPLPLIQWDKYQTQCENNVLSIHFSIRSLTGKENKDPQRIPAPQQAPPFLL